jgi:SNF2 family DNA or RNA helicase
MDDYFGTLSKEEIALNLELWEKFEKITIQDKKEIKKENKQIIPLKITKIDISALPDNIYSKLFFHGYHKLNDYQLDILHECIEKKFGALAVPMGSGKTIISICLALYLAAFKEEFILIVVSKSLISSWEAEIVKFFGKQLSYVIVDSTNKLATLKIHTLITLVTVNVLSGVYKANLINRLFIESKFVVHTRQLGSYINFYREVTAPWLNHIVGGGLFYSITWGILIADEIQDYTNIDTQLCQCLASLHTNTRWLLSGTIFDEPKIERLMGYHMILNPPGIPRNLPDMTRLIKSNEFKGLNEYLVHRSKNLAFIPPKLNDTIITHDLSKPEEKIYIMMKKILILIKDKAKKAKITNNQEELSLFNSYKLVMIMYLRQSLICPLIPITSIIIEASNMQKKSQLAQIIVNELRTLEIDDYLNDKDSVKSTRMKEILNVLDTHDEKCIVFSCFVSCLDLLEYFLAPIRPVFRLTSKMNAKKRGDVIAAFRNSPNGVLLLTYKLGAQGLNLQFAAVVLLADFYWSASRTSQSIARIFRYGQEALEVFVYFFTANTGIEKIIFEKQNAKLLILNELMTGKQTTTIPTIKLDEIIRLVEMDHNKSLLIKVNQNMYAK